MLDELSSDHHPVSFLVSTQLKEKEPRKYRYYRNTDWAVFKTDIKRKIQRQLKTKKAVDNAITYLTSTFTDVMERVIPTIEIDNR